MHRRHATAKPLQTMDLLQNGGRKKTGNGTQSRIALTYSGPVFRTAKPRPAVGALPAGGCGFDEVPMCFEKSGTGIEREPDAESLLAGGAFGSPQLLRNL